MPMDIDERVYNTETNISALTGAVKELAVMAKNAEERHTEDRTTMKDAIVAMSELKDKITAAIGMEKDIKILREKMFEQKTEVDKDISSITSNIAALQTDMDNIKTWKSEITGGAAALGIGAKVFWIVLGGAITTGIISLTIYLLKGYFTAGMMTGAGVITGVE
ncbi:MAG: hypothetical protein JWO78_218 [Micavibrio sp.]|nr:hypothetical protein [Micavibrio sp.]